MEDNLNRRAERENVQEENQEIAGIIGKTEEFVITAYCPCYECSEGWGDSTATGAKATEGVTVAVDPKKVPYGTKLVIDGKTYIAQDCGGAIKGNKIDMYFDTHEETVEWGVRNKQVTILN